MTPTTALSAPSGHSDGVLAAEPESLASAAAQLAGLADRLGVSSTGEGPAGGEPATLLAPVPQAAAFTAAMTRVRRDQASAMSGFTGFYRSSAESLSITAAALRRGEDAATARFSGMGTGEM
ncbi:MAG TPA: hypothetical protein H9870_03615 [Candidatus Corynebacterium avicola]|uniref:PE domain-containing protein n=1 Tax=Candidatus Corynebacterium avicola TaxID=2838527 RepID=A0A9D1UL82_9CORY|nr:hypothetical protein [Candidatus Corynebacterium avicola]